ncbi:MAG: hypothetical protein NTZ97_02125 [Candidatus Moranbacteria bacterium]|nr:hypothetical protein [Candidatus Moranbacteria bacterium]
MGLLSKRIGGDSYCRICNSIHPVGYCGGTTSPLQEAQMSVEHLEGVVSNIKLTSANREQLKKYLKELREKLGIPEHPIFSEDYRTKLSFATAFSGDRDSAEEKIEKEQREREEREKYNPDLGQTATGRKIMSQLISLIKTQALMSESEGEKFKECVGEVRQVLKIL